MNIKNLSSLLATLSTTACFAAAVPTITPQGPLPCFSDTGTHGPSRGVPCAVKSILDDHCSTCHDSATTAQIGRLDLSRWIALEDGTYGFPHLDSQGRQRPRAEAFARILDKITTPDKDERMPLGDELNPADLETLRSWAASSN
jgi:hypothetical protein